MKPQLEKILVIEDDASLAMGLVHNLKYEGFDVLIARDGDKGLAIAFSERPDLVILDVGLPGMNGFDVLAEIRRAGLELRIMMLTARGTDEDKVRGLGLGADDYMTKPFSVRELVARVNALLRRLRLERAEHAARPVTFKDVVLDPLSRTAQKAGIPKEMSAREFDLAMFLATHPDHVFSRDQILKAVWGWDYEGTERTVDNFIRAIRASLETDPTDPEFFVTVFGAGYMFRPGGRP